MDVQDSRQIPALFIVRRPPEAARAIIADKVPRPRQLPELDDQGGDEDGR